MSGFIDFLFDFGSPNAYHVHRAIPALEAGHGVHFRYQPILLGGVFKATGNQSAATAFANVPSKLAYEKMDRERFARRYGIDDFVMNPHFPVNTLQLMRGAVAAEKMGEFGYIDAMFRAMWRDGLKMDDPAAFRQAMLDARLPADAILTQSSQHDVKAELIAHTERAVARGAFGAPTFFVGDEMWFGKERLADVVTAAVG